MTIKAIDELKHSHIRMTTAISELERLEDGEDDFDYTEIVMTYREIVSKLEHRREVIQRKKYRR